MKPNEWPTSFRRFEQFRLASGLDSEPDAEVNALAYAMGDEADDIMAGLGLTDEERECTVMYCYLYDTAIL